MRLVPGILPNRAKRGVKPSSPFLLYRLLRCPCERIMTASRDGRGNRDVVYRCHVAGITPGHQRPYRVRESEVLPWVKAEADRFRVPFDAVELDAANDLARQRLEAKRDLIIDTYTDGKIDKAERDRRLVAVDADLAAVVSETVAQELPPIDWTWNAADVNVILGKLFEYVQLGTNLMPV